jgi:hypothetical protein
MIFVCFCIISNHQIIPKKRLSALELKLHKIQKDGLIKFAGKWEKQLQEEENSISRPLHLTNTIRII